MEEMTLQQLKYAVAVAESLNITQAAQKVYISQPSLTAAIHELEEEIGITIFSRTNKGVNVTNEGQEFLGYARQVLEQESMLEERYLGTKKQSPRFSVSCQHYSFAVEAFVDVIRQFDASSYDFTLRETQTYEIIDDVERLKSEIGVLYTSRENETIILKLIRNRGLVFEELFVAKPHIFVALKNPLAKKKIVTIEDLTDYPCLTYEQGDHNSFYFSEELLSTLDHSKNIKVRDRATLFNLAIGLNGYTICSGVINRRLNGEQIISIPLKSDEYMKIGFITRKDAALSRYGKAYIEALKTRCAGSD